MTKPCQLDRKFFRKSEKGNQSHSQGSYFKLNFIRALFENGKFIPIIDREYSLEQIADAYTYVATGERIGNVTINL